MGKLLKHLSYWTLSYPHQTVNYFLIQPYIGNLLTCWRISRSHTETFRMLYTLSIISCLLHKLLIIVPSSELFGISVERFIKGFFFLLLLNHALQRTPMLTGLVTSLTVSNYWKSYLFWKLTCLLEDQETISCLKIKAEPEYHAFVDTIPEIIWLWRLLADLGFP